MERPTARTIGEWEAAGGRPRSLREEIRANLLEKLRKGDDLQDLCDTINEGVDTIKNFEVGRSGDALDISDILTEVPDAGNIDEFVKFADNGKNITVKVDLNGGGNGFKSIAVLKGLSGVTVDELLDDGNIIVEG